MQKKRAFDHSKYQLWIDPNEVVPYEKNAKIHTDKQVKNIVNSIRRFGWQQDTVLTKDNVLVIGHGRRLAALEIGCEMPYHVIDKNADELTDEDIRELRIADNQTNAETGFDFDVLAQDVGDLDFDGFDFDFDFSENDSEEENEDSEQDIALTLSERFIVPPFSVLDAKQGYWQDRKRLWKSKIGDKGQARDVSVISSDSMNYAGGDFSDASLLDPVLCEIMLKWFAPGTGNVFDTFAGDTMFGYVSSYLGYNFTGIELRQEQCDFNRAACNGLSATYICDDGRNVSQYLEEQSQDFFFSCPPYFDLEVYSDLPNDASNQETYEEFYAIIDSAFTNAITRLKNNRFAVVVCGDVRDKKTGAYYKFPDNIKRTFAREGMMLYNELVLLDPIGTARIRASKYMEYRKVVKVHQNVLVFYKGNTSEIKREFPAVEVQYDSEDMEF